MYESLIHLAQEEQEFLARLIRGMATLLVFGLAFGVVVLAGAWLLLGTFWWTLKLIRWPRRYEGRHRA